MDKTPGSLLLIKKKYDDKETLKMPGYVLLKSSHTEQIAIWSPASVCVVEVEALLTASPPA